MSTIPTPGLLYNVFTKARYLPIGFCAHGGYYRAEVNADLKPVAAKYTFIKGLDNVYAYLGIMGPTYAVQVTLDSLVPGAVIQGGNNPQKAYIGVGGQPGILGDPFYLFLTSDETKAALFVLLNMPDCSAATLALPYAANSIQQLAFDPVSNDIKMSIISPYTQNVPGILFSTTSSPPIQPPPFVSNIPYNISSKEQNLPLGFCEHGGFYRAEVNPELKPVAATYTFIAGSENLYAYLGIMGTAYSVQVTLSALVPGAVIQDGNNPDQAYIAVGGPAGIMGDPYYLYLTSDKSKATPFLMLKLPDCTSTLALPYAANSILQLAVDPVLKDVKMSIISPQSPSVPGIVMAWASAMPSSSPTPPVPPPNVERIGTAPMCNPSLSDCQSKGMVMIGTCAVPSTNSVVYGPCREGEDNCDVYGSHAFCTNTVYPPSVTAVWMAGSNLGNRPLNSIPMIASHDTATYAIPQPSMGMNNAETVLTLSGLLSDLIAIVFPLGAPVLFIAATAALTTVLPFYNGDIPNFGPDSLDAYRDICSASNQKLSSVSDILCKVANTLSPDTVQRIVKGVTGLWSRAQSATISEQLTNGARSFDLRLCIDNAQETIPDKQLVFEKNVKFTHGLVCEITAVQFFTEIRDWIDANNAHGEFILLDFNSINNLIPPTKDDYWMYIGYETRIAFQRQLLQLLQSLFGSKLAPANIRPDHGYADFIAAGYQIITIFDNGVIDASNTLFVSKWQAEFPFVRSRKDDLSGTWETTLSDPVQIQAINVKELTGMPTVLNIASKFTVINGSGGLGDGTEAKDILMGILFPSQITGPNGLEQLSMKFTPNFVTSVLPPPYGHVPGQGWDRLPMPPGGYNFVSCDHFQKYNVSSLLIAWNRGELDTYGMRAVPTLDDSQCKCATKTITGGSVFDCGVCYTDPAGYDDTTCKGDGLACYSTTAQQCRYTPDCHWKLGMCTSDTGGALYCNNNGSSCTCHNPENRSCRADRECTYDYASASCISNTPGVSDDNCRYAGTDVHSNKNVCTCDNPDPLAPQCTQDSHCIVGAMQRSKSDDQNRGSHNCYILGGESFCATPAVQCQNDDQCHLDGMCRPRNGATGGYKCEYHPWGFDCECTRGLPGDVVNYIPGNPLNYPGYV